MRSPKRVAVAPRPPAGSQPSDTAKVRMRTRPIQNVGTEKPRMENAMIASRASYRACSRHTCRVGCPAASRRARLQAVSSSVAGSREKISSSTGMLKTKERPKIAGEDSAEKCAVLRPQRLIEAIGFDRLLPDPLRGIGGDQHIDRVADRINSDKHERRDDGITMSGLRQPLDDETQHLTAQSRAQAQPSAISDRVSATATSQRAAVS